MLKEHKILSLEKEPFGKRGWVLMVQCCPFPPKRCGICGFWLFVLEAVWVYVSRDKEGYRRGATTLISSP